MQRLASHIGVLDGDIGASERIDHNQLFKKIDSKYFFKIDINNDDND